MKPNNWTIVLALAHASLFNTSRAQPVDRPGTTFGAIVRDQLTASAGKDETKERVLELSEAVPLPSDRDSLDVLSTFDRVPVATDTAVFRPAGRAVQDVMSEVADLIEIGTRKLSDRQEKQLSESYKRLFVDDKRQVKTQQYEAYLAYNDKRSALLERLKNTSSAERPGLQLELTQLEREANLSVQPQVIEVALAIVATLDSTATEAMAKDWKARAAIKSETNFASVFDEVAKGSGWVRVAQLDERGELRLHLKQLEGGATKTRWVVFHFARIPLARPLLEHPLLRATNWRLKGGKVLSDGERKDTELELLPEAVSDLIIVKGVEIGFFKDDWDAVRRALGKPANLGGLTLDATSKEVFVSPRYLSIARPMIVGVVVRRLPRTPAPSSEIEWR